MDRYARHTILPWFGPEGQRRLRKSAVLVIGCGGTGCSCSSFLARAGLGKILLVDRDIVGLTDLHRQILYREADLEKLNIKVGVAKDALRSANHETIVEAFPVEFNSGNASSLVEMTDLIVDCSDNFETRMLINDVCLKYSIPWVHGACTGTAGIVIPFPQRGGACYRCVVDHIPGGATLPGAAPGIFGPVAGMVGCLEASEAVKILIAPRHVRSKIIYFDSLSYTHETINVRRKENCPACVGENYEFLEGGGIPRDFVDRESGTIHLALSGSLDLNKIHGLLGASLVVEDMGEALRVTTPEAEFVLLADGTAIVRGMQDLERARSMLDNLLKG